MKDNVARFFLRAARLNRPSRFCEAGGISAKSCWDRNKKQTFSPLQAAGFDPGVESDIVLSGGMVFGEGLGWRRKRRKFK